MLLEDFSKRKQDYKIRKLKLFSNIFDKKLKYDSKIKLNKSETKKLIKNIEEIDKKNETIFKHYSKIEKELIEYIAELNVKNYANEGILSPELRQMNEYNLKTIEILKRKRIKILDEKRKELEHIVEKCQLQEAQKRENILYDRIERDYLVFKKLDEAKHEMEKLVPKFKILEKEINTISKNNNELKIKYDYIKIENKCLTCLLNQLYKKNRNNVNNNSIILNSKINMNKSMVIKNQNFIKSNNNKYDTKIPNTSRLNLNSKSLKLSLSNSTLFPQNSLNFKSQIFSNINKKDKINNIFISQKSPIYDKILNKKLNKKRIASARIIDKRDEKNDDMKIEYIIKILKNLIYNLEKEYNEKYVLYSKEIETQNAIRNLINLCVEDLNVDYKEDKYDIIKSQKLKKDTKITKENDLTKLKDNKKIEKKLFIFSYIYDNCLKNGEIKELKKQYSMFPQNNNINKINIK